MKTPILVVAALLSFSSAALAQKPSSAPPNPEPAPKPAAPPVLSAPAAAPSPKTFIYEQRPVTARPYLVSPDQAQTVIDQFKAKYPEMGQPRMLIFVNRELIDQESGLKLSARKEEAESVRGDYKRQFASEQKPEGAPKESEAPATFSDTVVLGNVTTGAGEAAGRGEGGGRYDRVVQNNTYRIRERQSRSLADRQTIRDVERLFGRPLRMAGATLVDQRVATQLIGDQPLKAFAVPTEGEQARKDREALKNLVDVVVEVLISSRDVVTREVSGDRTYSVPDIQVTAMRLSDAQIVGQATSADLLGSDQEAGRLARRHDVREITEATALALMEDMMLQ